MPKTITLRLKDDDYELFKDLVNKENRPISNYIETAVKKYIEYAHNKIEFETNEHYNTTQYPKVLKNGSNDSNQKISAKRKYNS